MYNLHTHSCYSLLEGTISVDRIIDHARKSGSGYASLTDTNGMYGLIQFAKKAGSENIKPVLGAHIDDPDDKNLSALFFAKNNRGYSHLCKIITARKLKDDFSLVRTVNSVSGDLFIVTSSLPLLRDIENKSSPDIFAELIVTGKQKRKTRELYNYAKKNGINVMASHPAYFDREEDFLLHKVVTAIRLNTTLDNLDETETVDEEYCLKSAAELDNVWKSLPGAVMNSNHIARNCNVDLEFGKYKFPYFPLSPGETSFSYLWKICFRGLEEKYRPITDEAVKRLQSELEVIDELGFSDYFLVVWDIVNEAGKRRILSIGRGSAANSLVAYCLGITQIDPLLHNLYFERFLNRGRTSPPDVDLDFSWKERDEIVRYVYEKYGYDRVAMISTKVTFRARSAFRETAKVFGVSEREISKYSRLIPWTSAANLPGIAEKFPESKSLEFNCEPWKTIVNIASRLSGFPRHSSIHPGGIVITQNPVTNYLALEYAKNKGLGLIITQPDMYPVEDMGLIKIDLLSQRSLAVLRDTLRLLEGKTAVNREPKIFPLAKSYCNNGKTTL